MVRHTFRPGLLLLNSCVVFVMACGAQPTSPTTPPGFAAGGSGANACAGCSEPSLHLAIEPSTIALGAAVLRNGVPVHPLTFSVVLRETAGVATTLNGFFFELRSGDGVVLSRVDAGAWTRALPPGTTWKLLDQTMFVGDRERFGAGALTVRVRVLDPAGKSHEVTATAGVK